MFGEPPILVLWLLNPVETALSRPIENARVMWLCWNHWNRAEWTEIPNQSKVAK